MNKKQKNGWKTILFTNDKDKSSISREDLDSYIESFLASGKTIKKLPYIETCSTRKQARFTEPPPDLWFQAYTKEVNTDEICDRYDFSNDPISDLFK